MQRLSNKNEVPPLQNPHGPNLRDGGTLKTLIICKKNIKEGKEKKACSFRKEKKRKALDRNPGLEPVRR